MAARGISGHSRGDDSPPEAAVNLEVGVGGEQEGIGQDFGEPDQTGISDTHGNISKFVQKIENGNEGVLMEGSDLKSATATGEPEGGAAIGSEKMVRLGKCGLAGDPGRRMTAGLLDRPWVVLIVLSPEGDEKRGVNHDGISHSALF